MLIYFITALPKLDLNGKLLITKKAFIERAKKYLSNNEIIDLNILLKYKFMSEEQSKTIFIQENKYSYKKILILLNAYKTTKSIFFKAWIEFIFNLKEILIFLILKKKKISKNDAKKYFLDDSISISPLLINNYDIKYFGVVKKYPFIVDLDNYINKGNLLFLENMIDSIILKKMSTMPSADLFSTDTILKYYIKLSTIERKNSFNQLNGKKKIMGIVNKIDIRS